MLMNKRCLYLDRKRLIRVTAETEKIDAALRAKERTIFLKDQAISRVS